MEMSTERKKPGMRRAGSGEERFWSLLISSSELDEARDIETKTVEKLVGKGFVRGEV